MLPSMPVQLPAVDQDLALVLRCGVVEQLDGLVQLGQRLGEPALPEEHGPALGMDQDAELVVRPAAEQALGVVEGLAGRGVVSQLVVGKARLSRIRAASMIRVRGVGAGRAGGRRRSTRPCGFRPEHGQRPLQVVDRRGQPAVGSARRSPGRGADAASATAVAARIGIGSPAHREPSRRRPLGIRCWAATTELCSAPPSARATAVWFSPVLQRLLSSSAWASAAASERGGERRAAPGAEAGEAVGVDRRAPTGHPRSAGSGPAQVDSRAAGRRRPSGSVLTSAAPGEWQAIQPAAVAEQRDAAVRIERSDADQRHRCAASRRGAVEVGREPGGQQRSAGGVVAGRRDHDDAEPGRGRRAPRAAGRRSARCSVSDSW